MKRLLLAAMAALTLVPLSASARNETIAQIVAKNPEFNTLNTALKEARLEQTLSEKGPFTVFAPTDVAFAKLPKAKLDELLKNKKELERVLKYHVVSGRVTAAEVMKLKTAKTLEGADLKIALEGSKVMIEKAVVSKTDIEASNGVIHIVDSVLLPPGM